MVDTNDNEIKVLVTGFGPFTSKGTKHAINPSWEIARRLPSTLTHLYSSTSIRLIVPSSPIPAAYHAVLSTTSSLIAENDPDVIVHLGLDDGRECFAVERSANREGYHELPDVERKVVTRAENKKVFGKGPAELASDLDIESAVSSAHENLHNVILLPKDVTASASSKPGKGKLSGKSVDVRASDEVGNYVCGFIYYVSLLEMQKRGRRKNVVFLHVPILEGEEQIHVGVKVVEEVVKGLVGVWEGR